MGRRKGERKLPRDHGYQPYGPDHPVARSIATGDQWFHAWIAQYSLPYPRLKRLAGISQERAMELTRDALITTAEVEALAAACGNQPADIIASIPDPLLLEDGQC